MRIEQVALDEKMTKMAQQGFAEHALQATGFDGGISVFSFAAYENDKIIGIINCKFFWGQLHIRWLFVEPEYRDKGVGSALMSKAFAYAKEHGCTFAFVETMSFQAQDFYQKLGFVTEFSRPGYAKSTTFHYLRKDL